MEDLKKIQEFFSKPLNEGKQLDIEDFAKVVQAVTQTGHPVTVLLTPKFNEIEIITGMNAPDDMLFDLSNAVDSLGYSRNDIIIAGDSSNLSRREYSDIRRVNGGHKDYFEESVNEMGINDPVAMKMRAAKDKLAKMRAANAGDDGNDKFFDAAKLRALKKKRAQIMRDMEQEAELEGGPVADKYGDMLNKIDKAIAMLKEYNTGIYYNPTKDDTSDKTKDAAKSGLKKVRDFIQKVMKEEEITVDDATEFKINLKHLLDKHAVTEEEGYSQFLKTDDNPEGKTKGLDTKTMNKILMNVIKDLDELKQLGEGVIEEELCAKGKAYIKKRQAAGEKSSAYLSGRAVKVCKGQMKG
jgi:ribosomal protein L31E